MEPLAILTTTTTAITATTTATTPNFMNKLCYNYARSRWNVKGEWLCIKRSYAKSFYVQQKRTIAQALQSALTYPVPNHRVLQAKTSAYCCRNTRDII